MILQFVPSIYGHTSCIDTYKLSTHARLNYFSMYRVITFWKYDEFTIGFPLHVFSADFPMELTSSYQQLRSLIDFVEISTCNTIMKCSAYRRGTVINKSDVLDVSDKFGFVSVPSKVHFINIFELSIIRKC